MRHFLQATLHPAWYHGHGKRPPFFEGWYYKLVDPSERHRYAIIPGVFQGPDPESSHAFIQVLDGLGARAAYHRYPVENFWAAREAFDVRIGPNRFALEQIHLQIEAPECIAVGDLHFSDLKPWPVTLISPGVMGWYAWMPLMESYHGVLSFDHEIQGKLILDEERVDFSGGRGYIEKDWGRSFPAAWVWFQSNHFERPETSITASIAVIPWLRGEFPGFIIGFWHDGQLHRFATYTGARVEKLAIEDECVEWVVRGREHRLEILAQRAKPGLLRGPTEAGMDLQVPETLQASVAVRLVALASGQERPLFEGTGRAVGLEVVGETDRLLGQ